MQNQQDQRSQPSRKKAQIVKRKSQADNKVEKYTRPDNQGDDFEWISYGTRSDSSPSLHQENCQRSKSQQHDRVAVKTR